MYSKPYPIEGLVSERRMSYNTILLSTRYYNISYIIFITATERSATAVDVRQTVWSLSKCSVPRGIRYCLC